METTDDGEHLDSQASADITNDDVKAATGDGGEQLNSSSITNINDDEETGANGDGEEQLDMSCSNINNDEDAATASSKHHSRNIWRRPSISRLITLYRENESKIRDKKIRKNEVWNDIARCLKSEGLCDFDGFKCSQKMRNLTRDYFNYKLRCNITGVEDRHPPWFFGQLDSILSDRSPPMPDVASYANPVPIVASKSKPPLIVIAPLPSPAFLPLSILIPVKIEQEPLINTAPSGKLPISASRNINTVGRKRRIRSKGGYVFHNSFPEINKIVHVSEENDNDSKDIWTKASVLRLVALYKENEKKMADKETKKEEVWNDIAGSLKSEGLCDFDGLKCDKKCQSLMRDYRTYKLRCKATGRVPVRKDPPSFFDDLDSILSECNAANPVEAVDSLSQYGSAKDVWTKVAVFRLITLYGENQRDIKDKKTKKQEVWNRIARSLNSEGLCDYDGDRCSEKWLKLMRRYLDYKQNRKTAGRESRDAPWFFDDLDAVLSELQSAPVVDTLSQHRDVSVCKTEPPTEELDSSLGDVVRKDEGTAAAVSSKGSWKDFWKKSAVLRLIALYKENEIELIENKRRKKIWNRIAQCLKSEGLCDFGQAKCSQKWRNLVKYYLTYRNHCRTPGTEHREPPWFFNELEPIVSVRYPETTEDPRFRGVEGESYLTGRKRKRGTDVAANSDDDLFEFETDLANFGRRTARTKIDNISLLIRGAEAYRKADEAKLREQLQRQHMEKMELMRNLMGVFEKAALKKK